MKRTLAVLVLAFAVACTQATDEGGGEFVTGSPDVGGDLTTSTPPLDADLDDGGGDGPKLPEVPSVVGKRLDNAREALKRAGLRVSVRKKTSSKPEGTVLSQSVRAGSEVREGKTVKLVVAKPRPEPPNGDCQGYAPCIRPGPDVDCAGGTGDGPRYVTGPIYVTGSDPYGLDADGDGIGCE